MNLSILISAKVHPKQDKCSQTKDLEEIHHVIGVESEGKGLYLQQKETSIWHSPFIHRRSNNVMQTSSIMTVRRSSTTTSAIDIWEDLSPSTDDLLMQVYREASSPDTRVIILNFRHRHIMNSRVVGSLISLLIRIQRQQQHLLVVALSEYDRRIFSLTALDKHIRVFETEEQALATIYRNKSENHYVAVPA